MQSPRVPLIEEAITGYETIAEYDRYASIYMWPEYRYFVEILKRKDFNSGRVLDIGTGSGRLAIQMAKHAKNDCNIIGLDISDAMLQKAEETVIKEGLSDRLTLVQSTAERLPFSDSAFDLVISYASLHHWLHPVAVINEMARVLKKNGRLIIRDNQRITGRLFWELAVKLIGCFMSKNRYLNWRKVILASYTLSEVEAILKKTNLKNYLLVTDFVKFDLHIEAVKN